VPVAAMSSSKKLTLGSKPAVLIDNIMICGGCTKGVIRGTRTVEIYMLSGRTWTKVLSEEYFMGDIGVLARSACPVATESSPCTIEARRVGKHAYSA
jgi:hypothetical protein